MKKKTQLTKRLKNNQKIDPRQKKFKKLRKTKTLREIGEIYNISGERVRQIVRGNPKIQTVKVVKEKYIENVGDILGSHLQSELRRLSTDDRRKEIVLQRQAVIRTLHDKYKFSFKKIGRLLKREHSSVRNLYYKNKKK